MRTLPRLAGMKSCDQEWRHSGLVLSTVDARWERGRPRPRSQLSQLRAQLAEIVALADLHAFRPQDVIGGDGMKIETRQREREQKGFGGEDRSLTARIENELPA